MDIYCHFVPDHLLISNNRSASAHPDLVLDAIQQLLYKGCVSNVSYIPHVINPLTVAINRVKKKRIVLECRHINLDLFKYKCCYEGQSVARQMFSKGEYLSTFDIRNAYHYVMLRSEHRTYLG